jgi:phage recombination protein Bet
MAQKNTLEVSRNDSLATHHDDLFSDARIELIRNQTAKNAPDDVFLAMIDIAKRRNLDPLSKQISLIPFGGVWQMIVTIDGYRAIAEQTGAYAGMDAPVFTYEGDERTAAGKRIPDSATVTVYKLINGVKYPFSAMVFWEEYSTGKNNWNTMPRTMLAKVAESHALRKAFPAVLSGTYTGEEMEQAAIETTARVVEMPQQRSSPAQQPRAPQQLPQRTPAHRGPVAQQSPANGADGKAVHYRRKLKELQGAIRWTDADLEALTRMEFGKGVGDATGDELEVIHGDLQQMFRNDPPALDDLKRRAHGIPEQAEEIVEVDPETGEVIPSTAGSATQTEIIDLPDTDDARRKAERYTHA